jgi:hypothetical protein
MEQVPDSPINTYQRKMVIAGLKRANRSELTEHVKFAVIAAAYIEIIFILPPSPMIRDKYSWYTYAIYTVILLSIGTCYLLSAWMVELGISRLMRRHAAPVFAGTNLVAHVLGLPTDAAAFRGWHIAWLAGEWLTRKQKQYNLRRRIKAIHARFGAWSRHFGCSPEPWAVRLVIYIAACVPLCYAWLIKLLAPKESTEVLLVLVIVFYIIWGLIASVFQGRRAGIRSALIDYFEAEAARGDVGEAEHGASDG